MFTSIVVASAALLLGAAPDSAADDVRGDMFVAQGMTGSAGSNSSTTAVSPRTDPGPAPDDESHDAPDRARRTSRDFGSGDPLAGDERARKRPNADGRPSAAGDGRAPAAPHDVR